MADIELIIKIPEEIYKASQIINVKYEDVIQIPLEVIKNGIPLPKGHGKLIDIEEVDRSLSAHVTLSNNPKEDWKHIYEAIEAVPTIIEAEFDLKDGDTMPEHMDLEYMEAKLDFHCRPTWIPCNERLPEKGEKVLASTKNTVFTQVFKGIQGTPDSWWWNNHTIKTIYAWMPLPEAWEGGEE